MDRTETFIKMVDCPEIQDKWYPFVGDVFLHRENGKVETNPIYKTTIDWMKGEESLIPIAITWPEWKNRFLWLPRQDQLQEMISIYPTQFRADSSVPWHSFLADDITVEGKFDSMEQLWLAFVMKEKYNKVWNGEEWT